MKTLLSPSTISLVLVCAPAAMATEDHGDVTLTLSATTALDQTGQPEPSHDAACRDQYGDWIGRTVETSYTIDPQTLMMSASSTIQGLDVQFYPLGIQGFMPSCPTVSRRRWASKM